MATITQAKRRRSQTPVVKSASRALEVLEFLGNVQHDVTLMEVSRSLNVPQSSASMLLRSLVNLGYLHYMRYPRTYRPTARFALIGSRVEHRVFGEAKVLPLMRDISQATGECVFLSVQDGMQVRLLHAVGSERMSGNRFCIGAVRPLASTASGRLFLSTLAPSMVRPVIRHLNTQLDPAERMSADAWMAELDRVRQRGYAVASNQRGQAAVAVAMPSGDSEHRVAIVVGGPCASIMERHPDHAARARAVIARHASGWGAAPGDVKSMMAS